MYGVGFFDNPGLCYSPFSVNWDDILEYPDLQPVILVPMNDKAATFNWLSACAARYESASQRKFSALLPTTSASYQGSDLVSTSKQKWVIHKSLLPITERRLQTSQNMKWVENLWGWRQEKKKSRNPGCSSSDELTVFIRIISSLTYISIIWNTWMAWFHAILKPSFWTKEFLTWQINYGSVAISPPIPPRLILFTKSWCHQRLT